jgi:hypothetical protein
MTMTKKQAQALRQRILALNWDSNIKRAKAVNLSRLLCEKAERHARFTRADYATFFKSRRIKPTWR